MAARFPGGGNEQDLSVSDAGSDFILDSALLDQSDPQPGPSQQIKKKRSTMDYTVLMETDDINELKLWIRNHILDVIDFEYFRDEIEYILSEYIPTYKPGLTQKAEVMIGLLKRILPVKERLNISVNVLDLLEGSKLAAKVEKHKERIMDNMIDVETEADILRQELDKCRKQLETYYNYIIDLETKLGAALRKLGSDEARMFGPVPENDPLFLAQMQRDLKVREDLESSLHEEVTRSRNAVDRLTKEVNRLKRELVSIDHDKIKELAEIAQDIEIDERLKRSLIDKINTLNASTDECNRAIAEWMNAIQESFNGKRESIAKTKEEIKLLDNEVAKQEAEVQNLAVKRNEMNMELAALEECIAEREMEVQGLEHHLSQLEEEKLNLSRHTDTLLDSILSASPYRSPRYIPRPQDDHTYASVYSILSSTPSKSPRELTSHPQDDQASPRKSPGLFNFSAIPYIDDSSSTVDSPEQFRAGDSPRHWQEHLDDTGSSSLDSSRDGEIPDIRIYPPSPPDLDLSYDLHIPSPIAPGTQTISQPRSRMVPSTSKANPSTQTIKNRIDVGKSLNMKTVQSGLTSPYYQNTRLVSNVPLEGTSRMVDRPFNIKHMADLTPRHFVTPFISTTRFGYTDPKAKVLNLPPGDNYELDTVLKKRLLLTSPQREEPLLVDIGVQPQPLVHTSSGEHFVCDISLDVQQAGKKQPHSSPVFTYGTPPAVTPTITRRQLAAPFTPKGIFKKKHYNIRRVIGPHYESPGKYFPPHHLPFDSRSPISNIPHNFESPCYSDGTISWEKVPGLDNTYDNSMMNRTFDRSASPVINKTYGESPSPVIKPSYRFRMQDSFTSSERSQSPVHGRTFDSSSSSRSGGTYDKSMSPKLNVTFDRSSSPRSISPRLDATFDHSSSPRSMSPRLDGTLDRSSSSRSISPGLNVTFDRSWSPSSGGTFDRSVSPRSGGTYNRSMSPKLNVTFDSSASPRSGGAYDRSISPLSGGTYERSMSPRLDATFDSNMSPSSGGTSDRSMSPKLNVTFDSSASPRSGGAYDRSISPLSGGTYERSMSSRLDETFDSSMSPSSGGTSDRSMSSRSAGTYDRSMSPRLNATFDSSRSPRSRDSPDSSFSSLNRAFIQGSSPGMDGSFGGSPSPRLDNTFEQSPSSLNRAFYEDGSPQSEDSSRSASLRNDNFGHFPRVNRTHNVSVSPRLNRTYDVSYPYLMERPFIESPQLNRSFSPQRFNESSDQSSFNTTFDTYSSQNSALSDEDWSFDSGYSSYVSNQSGNSGRSP